MNDNQLILLQNQLKFYEAFHSEIWMSGLISTDTTYGIELKAQKISGYDSDGQLVTWDTSEID